MNNDIKHVISKSENWFGFTLLTLLDYTEKPSVIELSIELLMCR